MNAHESRLRSRTIAARIAAALPGHFPGRPIAPGVCCSISSSHSRALARRAARVAALPQAKFTAPLLPDRTRICTCRLDGDELRFWITREDAEIAQGVFRLRGRNRGVTAIVAASDPKAAASSAIALFSGFARFFGRTAARLRALSRHALLFPAPWPGASRLARLSRTDRAARRRSGRSQGTSTAFAAVTLDRAFLLSESFRRFDIRTYGLDELRKAWAQAARRARVRFAPRQLRCAARARPAATRM